jgi:hypothetical protein
MSLPEAVRPGQLVRSWPAASRSILVGYRARPWVASLALFCVAYFGYLALAALIVFGSGSVPVDTWARVGNASYALYSRDPHLGAIGFVLPPVPTIAIMPVLPFKAIWPALVTSAFAGPITSAAFMAGGVVLVRRILRDLGVSTWLVWVLVALFAVHPMIAYYGANGLTEAAFVFCLLWATSSFMRWLDRGALADLVRLGMALAVGYLTRYEFIAAAPFAVGLVAVVSYVRTAGATSERRMTAAADAVIVGLPFVLAFVGWAFVSWLLVGSPFSQFTSIYGNSSQVRLLHDTLIVQTGQGTAAAFGYVARQVLGLAPLLPVIAILALIRSGLRLDQRVLAPAVVIGGPVLFSVIAFLVGSTVGFLRYEIAAIPLLVVLAGFLLARRMPTERFSVGPSQIAAVERIRARLGEARRSAVRIGASVSASPAVERTRARLGAARLSAARIGASASASQAVERIRSRLEAASRTAERVSPRVPMGAIMGVLVALGIALSLPTGLATMRHPLLAREEADALRSVLGNDPPTIDPSYVLATHTQTRRAAAAIDRLDLAPGSVLMDTATGNPVVLQSAHPDWFVITPDRDFERILADPVTFGVRYVVVTDSALDAVNRAYPGLYATGAGMATLVGTYNEAGTGGWRLYRLDVTP